MNKLTNDLDRFYSILSRLQRLNGQGLPLSCYNGKSTFPLRGVYFFLEPGEFRTANPDMQRVVRIGTHAVSLGSKSTLWKRLKAHLGTNAGGGNHRGSIFRLHIGAALLVREGNTIPTWGIGSSAPQVVRQNEALRIAEEAWEQRVTKLIGSMRVLWVDVPDAPSPDSNRAFIERNSIALLSNHLSPLDAASANWLGCDSAREDIRLSGLWNLNHVRETYHPEFLDVFDFSVGQMAMHSQYSDQSALSKT